MYTSPYRQFCSLWLCIGCAAFRLMQVCVLIPVACWAVDVPQHSVAPPAATGAVSLVTAIICDVLLPWHGYPYTPHRAQSCTVGWGDTPTQGHRGHPRSSAYVVVCTCSMASNIVPTPLIPVVPLPCTDYNTSGYGQLLSADLQANSFGFCCTHM